MLVEVELQLLICHIDTQLLKWIATEVFKSKDVENSNAEHVHCLSAEWVEYWIDPVHKGMNDWAFVSQDRRKENSYGNRHHDL